MGTPTYLEMRDMKRTRATHIPSNSEVYVIYELEPYDDSEYATSDSRVMLVQNFADQVFAVPNSDLRYHYTPEGSHVKE